MLLPLTKERGCSWQHLISLFQCVFLKSSFSFQVLKGEKLYCKATFFFNNSTNMQIDCLLDSWKWTLLCTVKVTVHIQCCEKIKCWTKSSTCCSLNSICSPWAHNTHPKTCPFPKCPQRRKGVVFCGIVFWHHRYCKQSNARMTADRFIKAQCNKRRMWKKVLNVEMLCILTLLKMISVPVDDNW